MSPTTTPKAPNIMVPILACEVLFGKFELMSTVPFCIDEANVSN
jgi:hypothetical protein